MTNQMTVAAPTLPGLLPDAEALDLAKSFRVHNENESRQTFIDRLPTAVDRQILSTRASAISEALRPICERPSDRVEASRVIADLLVGYGVTRNDKAAPQTVTVYVKHLERLPLFAVKAACDDVQNRRVFDVDRRTGNRTPLDPTYAPSTVRLGMIAEKHVDALYAEKFAFDRVLAAKRALPPPASADQRAKVAAKFADLQRKLAAAAAENDLEETERRARQAVASRAARERQLLDEYERLGLEPARIAGTIVSPELAKMIGVTAKKHRKTIEP